MPSPKGDPTYIKNKERFFMDVALSISKASTHPKSPGGCIIVRDREIIGDGRSLLTDSMVEIDCISYAIAAAVGSASKVKYYLPLVWHASSQFVEITAAVTSHNARRLGLVRRGCFNSGYVHAFGEVVLHSTLTKPETPIHSST